MTYRLDFIQVRWMEGCMDWEPAGKSADKPGGKKRRGCLVAVVVIVLIAIVGGIISSCGGGDDSLDWPSSGLATMLPKPDSGTGNVVVNSDDSFSASVDGYTQEKYDSYVAQCQEMGFSVEAENGTGTYAAYSEEGYHLSLSFFGSSDGSMNVTLDAPVEMGTISWPTAGAGSLAPAPTSTTGKIDSDSSTFFFAYVGETNEEAFAAYVDACSSAGFNVDYDRGDTWYGADNAEGVSLRVEYRGFNTMVVRVDAPDDAEAAPEPESTAPEAEAPTTPEAEVPATPESSAGGSSDFRATMDAYEAFMNEYCDFMETYSSDSSNVVSMALDYADMMSRYSDMTEQIDAIDENSLSADDLAYYTEVMGRVNARLLEIGQ